MHVSSFRVSNFRLLHDVHLSLGNPVHPSADMRAATTVVVGRNNSGKTGLTEVFRRFAAGKPFRLEDFSNASYGEFCEAYGLFLRDADDLAAIRDRLPHIELRIEISYDPNQEEFGPLAEFIVDLDETASTAIVVARYELAQGRLGDLFDGLALADAPSTTEAKADFLQELASRIPDTFERTLAAEAPNDPQNRRTLPWSDFERLLMVSFITAQRGLDDVTERDTDMLARLLETLFSAARQPGAPAEQQQVAEALTEAVSEVQDRLNASLTDRFGELVPTLADFGYPGLHGPTLAPEISLEVTKLLQRNTKLYYSGYLGVSLPEAYNGLGPRNLIAMLLHLLSFKRVFEARGTAPGLHLTFIEEPEAHLHPQMQEVFIRQLNLLASGRSDAGPSEWSVQFVVSTHSSHIANEAPFSAIRYFLTNREEATPAIRETIVKDLGAGQTGLDAAFLHQYLTLTRCDLFFADAAILIEGTAERLLLPAMAAKLDEGETQTLASRHLALMEVGGAYAHKFFALLDFLELPALVVTDLDPVKATVNAAGHTKWTKCLVEEGERTSNATLKAWFDNPEIALADLAQATEADKTKANRRVAYQVPEHAGGPCGHTLEDAFILANGDMFGLAATEQAINADSIARSWSKSGFALHHALETTDWVAPSYIREGLQWLLETT